MDITRKNFGSETKLEETGETDWTKSSDIINLYNLEYSRYGEEAGHPDIVRKWHERNPHICRALYNKFDRRDFWGAMMMLPLKEATIFKLLRGEMRDIDLNPVNDISTFEESGTYDFYVASVIVHPQRKQYFQTLMNSVFDFWCEQAPERRIGKIYVRVVSVDGEMMTRKLFFSPLLHISDSAYMLDIRRPNPSRFVQSFQYCVNSKSMEHKEANTRIEVSAQVNLQPMMG